MPTSSPEHPPLGGHFALDPALWGRPPRQDPADYFGLDQGGHLWLASGRAALTQALALLGVRQGHVLVPEFLCGRVLLDTIESAGLGWRAYPLSAGLEVDWQGAAALVDRQTTALLAINYFGVVDQGPAVAAFAQEFPQVATILDCAQDPYLARRRPAAGQGGQALFTSLRKLFPLPDGAFLRLAHPAPLPAQPVPQQGAGVYAWLAGAMLKHGYLAGAQAGYGQETYLRLLTLADSLVEGRPRGASAEGLDLLGRLDLEQAAQIRRSNYAWLTAALDPAGPCRPLVPSLGPQQVPSHLPVLVDAARRDRLRAFLAGQDIFCPVHWPSDPRLAGRVSPQGLGLYRGILSLLIDQRLGPRHLQRLAGAINSFD